ncbi:DNA (cytosine-5-)-methyltransferase [Lottiidibacillus patelloidae]|uniref:Cytosine-specific methyltransferase n=1 Tax=Lottiidibacillus patelloidae TaxID=2670334 RepID=A0A263BT59_9BACI|nr:DNA (cytosine-5-)-methyltransferase [Lottiidibacillus patelloidae]OZM56879.1 DNA (cytosine-5-)-methyltransferase [Lottiidibacillus patelloidae]
MLNVVSLFSGCGGLDYGFMKAGFNVVWANDVDKFAVQTYRENFGNHIVLDDIQDIDIESIPDPDILLAGFPCQPFSMMGSELGFNDARGTLFFHIAKIINAKKPEIIVLENVRTLRTHDGGKTYKVIMNILENELGYKVFDTVLNSADFGVPQKRNRTFIVGFRDHTFEYEFPQTIELDKTMQDLLEKDVPQKYFLSERILKTILSHGTKNYRATPEIDLKVARPLCATMAKMHRASQDNYVTDNGKVRRLTPRECARLQGFPEDFKIVVSDTQAYKQFGNAVTVNVSYYVAVSILQAIIRQENKKDNEVQEVATT